MKTLYCGVSQPCGPLYPPRCKVAVSHLAAVSSPAASTNDTNWNANFKPIRPRGGQEGGLSNINTMLATMSQHGGFHARVSATEGGAGCGCGPSLLATPVLGPFSHKVTKLVKLPKASPEDPHPCFGTHPAPFLSCQL